MKTYILEEQYGDNYRVTVEDDVQVSAHNYESNHEGCLVKFTTQGNNYNDNIVAAFGHIKQMWLDGTNIEKKSYHVNKIAKAETAEMPEQVWVAI